MSLVTASPHFCVATGPVKWVSLDAFHLFLSLSTKVLFPICCSMFRGGGELGNSLFHITRFFHPHLVPWFECVVLGSTPFVRVRFTLKLLVSHSVLNLSAFVTLRPPQEKYSALYAFCGGVKVQKEKHL